MAAIELATGYVTLAAETRTLTQQIAAAFKGAGDHGARAGREIGSSMAKAFKEANPIDMDSIRAKVENAEKAMAQSSGGADPQGPACRRCLGICTNEWKL